VWRDLAIEARDLRVLLWLVAVGAAGANLAVVLRGIH
jgi:hypothetical protein